MAGYGKTMDLDVEAKIAECIGKLLAAARPVDEDDQAATLLLARSRL